MEQYIWDHIKSEALKYDFDNVKAFINEYEWEPEWMDELMEDPDAEIFSLNDRIAINEVLLSAFMSAHGRFLPYGEYKYLLYN